VALIVLLTAGVILFFASFLQLRRGEAVTRLANQLGLLATSGLMSVLFVGLFVLAAALPLYARLTER
jgi:HAMP domain-containing protein